MGRPNVIRVEGDIAYIELTDRRGRLVAEAIIDAADVEKVSSVRWYAVRNPRAVPGRDLRPATSREGRDQCGHWFLYRFLVDASPKDFVDHQNHHPLDCRRSNLRTCTHPQNCRNRHGAARDSRSGVRNVWWDGKSKKWEVRVRLNGKSHFAGRFDDLSAAETAAQAARAQLHGAFAS